MPDAFPRLRCEIDAAPASRDGETFYILYDRAGVTASRLLVSPLGLLIAGRLDGGSSVLDISDKLTRECGGSVACSEVEKIVAALDEAFFLDGDRFQDFQEQAARDFRAAPVRVAGSAGSAYSDDPAVLAADLDAMMASAPPPEEAPVKPGVLPRGVVVPHIDYPRGAPGYGQLYGMLRQAPPPRTVVVIGTAHVPLSGRFSLCEKDFDTPFGIVGVDRALSARLREAVGPHGDIDRDVLAHRGEHSVELQAVWLRHIYGEEVRIVPILAGTLADCIDDGGDVDVAVADPCIGALAGCLADAVAEGGVMIMASADRCHVGPRFGDDEEVTNDLLSRVEEVDRDYLEALAVDARQGLESLASHGDRHHVCGSACIFALGRALAGAEARLLGYHQAVTPEMGQAVTYAAMVFE